MNVKVEKLENNMVKLTVEVDFERFDKAIEEVFRRNRSHIAVPGFRKGKAPRKMIEHAYGAGVFFEDAANLLIPEAYDEAVKESGETIVSRPSIDIVQIEAGKPLIFTAEAALKPEVVLGDYKGLTVEVPKVTVTDEDVQKELDSEREKNSRMVDVTDRPVKEGDLIKLDFDGSVDGTPFEGGKAEDYPLTIGSGSFIPGFEEQLVGMSIGEEKDVTVTFPEDYHAEDLKGKEAVFKCTINSIQVKELPDVDDEFAQDVSEFDTLEEYKEDIRRKLTESREADAKRMKETAVVDKIVENASMDIPEGMIDEQVSRMVDDFRRRVESQGMALEQYLQYTGMDIAKMTESMRPEALKRIQNSLVLEAVAKAENITISEERVDEEIAKMAEQYKMEPDKLKEIMGEYEISQMKEDLAVQAAVDFVRDNAVEVEPSEE